MNTVEAYIPPSLGFVLYLHRAIKQQQQVVCRFKSGPESTDNANLSNTNRVFEAPLPEVFEWAEFSSGATLALLFAILADANTEGPTNLLRNRLGLLAAENLCKIEGRSATEADLREAFVQSATSPVCRPDPSQSPARGLR